MSIELFFYIVIVICILFIIHYYLTINEIAEDRPKILVETFTK
jgi:hypothetical protein